ncbi:hypothetical protein SASPL_132894 [Salvia splendens]|uniref:DUF7788 domain-containing protein n=1 Tax=Salvia splendens TaxID=180675 RepID=A0A8X8X2S8_SALSN|nr:hypothetical protein SASPL_132894 [Salvia splendens]
MLDDMAKIGKLSNCLAISDVSGSMYGIPMKVSVALGILVSELSEEPWKGKLITLSENPQLQKLEGERKPKAEEMIKRLFVFSDMEFDEASTNTWEADYEAIVRKYKEKGYGECVLESQGFEGDAGAGEPERVLVFLARWKAIVLGEDVRGIGFNQGLLDTNALPIITYQSFSFKCKAFQLIVAILDRLARWSNTSC